MTHQRNDGMNETILRQVIKSAIRIAFPKGNYWVYIPTALFIIAYVVIGITIPTAFGFAEECMLDGVVEPNMYWFEIASKLFFHIFDIIFVMFVWFITSLIIDLYYLFVFRDDAGRLNVGDDP